MTSVDITYSIQITSATFCKYVLQIGNKNINLSFPQLLQLRNSIYNYCKPENLEKVINGDNFILLPVAGKSHILYLDVNQLFDIKIELAFFFEDYKTVSF